MSYSSNRSGRPGGVPSIVIYIAVAVVAIIALWLLMGLLTAGIQAYFALICGIVLLAANARELLTLGMRSEMASPLMNMLIGLALVFFFLGSAFGALLFIPAILAVLLAVPLALRRGAVAPLYLDVAYRAVDGLRRMTGSRVR